ncbi:MAG: histidinol-phosphate transaminase [Flavobacteriaceae bacterium]|nr:histidinol-phosphate transaminase [Flavobacteriaceae bacterium]
MREVDINKLVRPNVLKMEPYSSARDEFSKTGEQLTFLDANENPFDNGWNRYPDPRQRLLKSEIAALKAISEDNILLGNGSDEVLDLLFRAFCEPGKDNIITLPPTYGMYNVLANTNDIANREVLLNRDFQIRTDAVLAEIDQNTKLIFVCSPNNPTGNIISETAIRRLLDEFKGIVVIDEAYIDFAESESWVKKLNDFKNLIVLQTFSKAYGMASIRLGMGFASEEIIAILNKIKPPYNVNGHTQEKALETLKENEVLNKQLSYIKENKEVLVKVLLQVSFVAKIYPSDANFLLIKVDDADKRYNQLLEFGIVVRNRSNQPLCENTLRITVGTAEENNRLIKAFQKLDV